MAAVKEFKQKIFKFGLPKDGSFEVENVQGHDEGNAFTSTRDYWQHMCKDAPAEGKPDVSLQYKCNYIIMTRDTR